MKMSVDIKQDLYESRCPNTGFLNDIPVIPSNTPYEEFFEQYLLKNQACIIKDVTNDWKCRRRWVKRGQINFSHLYRHYGTTDVMVYDCDKKHYNSQESKSTKLVNYLVYWEAFVASSNTNDFSVLYLKDWHLKNAFPDDNFYEVPLHFKSDWLNEYFVENGMDDYRFVYIGPKGSWTPFHTDVFNSYSWSANVHGTKRWILLPPGEENLLRDSLGNLPYDIEPVKDKVRHFDIIQNTGDAVFVPSGWYHQVWNIEHAISVNHNWVNGCNIMGMWLDLQANLGRVVKEIDDCKGMDDFNGQAQIVLKASYGLDYSMFFDFVVYIGQKRMKSLGDGGGEMGKNHLLFDLKCIKEVLDLFVANEDVKGINSLLEKVSKNSLLNEIYNLLEYG